MTIISPKADICDYKTGLNEDHMILSVGKFEYALSLEMDMLINGEFSIDGE